MAAGTKSVRDPVHGYIEVEPALLPIVDAPLLQRLRQIRQLGFAYLVYPGANHTRFEHSLGAMHLARRLSSQLELDSCTARTVTAAALLHDVGHGPFGHFFDDHFLNGFKLTHEDLGRQIIVRKLGRVIARIRRSPSGPFADGESLDPAAVAFLIKMPEERDGAMPRWLQLLRQLFSGIYTVDNLDYVQRDAFMT
ncbi:MAG TPA: HD domain-containing protein, partial [Methanoregulaceae archaeon]|nr:HD domain-containing protein [Methanoregulaceae archaeon]